MADYRVYTLSRREKAGLCCALAAALGLLGSLFYDTPLPVLLLPLVWRFAARGYGALCLRRQRQRLLLQFRDVLYSLSAALAAGHPMQEALAEAEQNLSEMYTGSLMEAELAHMQLRMAETGVTDLAVLEDLAERSGLEDVSDFAEVFRACRGTGGNLIEAVDRAAAVIGEKITVEQEIRTIVAQKKLEGRIITAMPLVVLLFLRLSAPEYLTVLYTTLAGRLLMSVALAVIVAACVLIERITEIEI